jgi:septin family protein
MAGKEFKIVLAGAFGSGRTTFVSSLAQAKKDSKKIRPYISPLSQLSMANVNQLQSKPSFSQSSYRPLLVTLHLTFTILNYTPKVGFLQENSSDRPTRPWCSMILQRKRGETRV